MDDKQATGCASIAFIGTSDVGALNQVVRKFRKEGVIGPNSSLCFYGHPRSAREMDSIKTLHDKVIRERFDEPGKWEVLTA